MKVRVTAEDIAAGVPCDNERCPIALALLRQTGRPWKVDASEAENGDGGRFVLPDEAAVFVQDFDNEYGVEPFEFEVSDP
jgi:hypothetical protein